MNRLSRLLLLCGLAVALPATALGDVPAADRPEMASHERAELRRAVIGMRAVMAQLNDAVRQGRFCGPMEEVRAARRELDNLEWAYAHHVPYPINRPKSPAGR